MSRTLRRRPWARGAATAAGGLPGVDPLESARIVFGELGQLPFLPELPDRGIGAQMIGRTLALLVDLPVEVAPSGWRVADHRSRAERQARDLLARDLDVLDEVVDQIGEAPALRLKVQAAGPWTLAAQLELRSGHTVLSDRGARRDLAQSLTQGLAEHAADLRRRLPGAQVVLQIDEPALPAVLAGRIPTPSGVGAVDAVEEPIAEQALAELLAGAGADATAVHCCAPAAPLQLFGRAGVDAVSFDAALVSTRQVDALGELVEAGVSLWPGVVDHTATARVQPGDLLQRVLRLWRLLGFGLDELPDSLVPSSACGLSGARPDAVRPVLAALAAVGEALLDPQPAA